MTGNGGGHRAAFNSWFARYEIERKKKHFSPGRTVPGFPSAPPGPDEVRRVIFNGNEPIGERRAAELCSAHRTTVSRWLSGTVQIPGPAYALLLFHADGVPPGCGQVWQGFAFGVDSLTTPTGLTLSAREIEGVEMLKSHNLYYAQKISELEAQLIEMTRRAALTSGCANDDFSSVQDVRSRAFIA